MSPLVLLIRSTFETRGCDDRRREQRSDASRSKQNTDMRAPCYIIGLRKTSFTDAGREGSDHDDDDGVDEAWLEELEQRAASHPLRLLWTAAKRRERVMLTPAERPAAAELLACTDADGRSPLHLACAIRSLPTVHLLLARKADINACDDRQRTVVMQAAHWGHRDMVEDLLHFVPDVTLLDADERQAVDLAEDIVIREMLQRAVVQSKMPKFASGTETASAPPKPWPEGLYRLRVEIGRGVSSAGGGVSSAAVPAQCQQSQCSPIAGQVRCHFSASVVAVQCRGSASEVQARNRADPQLVPKVEHLPSKVPQEVLAGELRSILRSLGTRRPINFEVVRDPVTDRPRGHAYMDFDDLEAVDRAMLCDGTDVWGSTIRVIREQPLTMN